MVDNSKILHCHPAKSRPTARLKGFQNSNLHTLLVFRHDDLGFRFHRAQRFQVGDALEFLRAQFNQLLALFQSPQGVRPQRFEPVHQRVV